jgi:hypothetical protein
MTVSVDFSGRRGNNLFQYSYARLLAELNGLHFQTEWPYDDFVKATVPKAGKQTIGVHTIVSDGSNFAVDASRPIRCKGYFQDVEVFNQYRDIILSFWKPEPVTINHDDIVIHLRLTDYYWCNKTGYNKCVISPMWYIDILRKEKYRRLFIVVEPHCTNQKYLANFERYSPTIVSGTPKSDFDFVRSFDKIITSNSTFAWWAAYLSKASVIYTFRDLMRKKANNNLAYMKGARVLAGQFYRDRNLEVIDWSDYWKQPDSFFKKAGRG